MTKMTKNQVLDVIASVFETIAADNEHRDEVMSFCNKEREALAARSQKARERAAEKRAQGDVMTSRIEALLNTDPKNITDILAELNDEAMTPAKVTSRMTRLVNEGKAIRTYVKADGQKRVAYIKG